MAPEETAEAASLLRNFERRFLAARSLRSFPWQVGNWARGERLREAVERAPGSQTRPPRHVKF